MATLPEAEFIWFNGKLVPWQDANIHVLSHVVHYGSSFFEGMRCYETKRGPAVFRLDEHVDRLFDSCKIYRVEIPYSRDEIREAVLETIRSNKLGSCYVRPVVYRGYGLLSVRPPWACPVEVAIGTWNWGRLSRRRRPGERRGRMYLILEPSRAEHPSRPVQGRGVTT